MRTDEKVLEALEQVAACIESVNAGLATFHNAVRLQAARTVQVLGEENRRLVSTAGGRLLGWSFHETATPGAVATIVLRDARVAAGDILAVIDLAAGSDTQWFGPHGIAMTAGLYVELVTGSAHGVVYLGTDQA